MTTAAPVFKNVLTAENSNLSVTLQDATPEFFAVLASNSGIRPGILTRAFIRVSHKDGSNEETPLQFRTPGVKDVVIGAVVVEGGQTLLANFFVERAAIKRDLLDRESLLLCELVVKTAPFSGFLEDKTFEFPCFAARGFLRSAVDYPPQFPARR